MGAIPPHSLLPTGCLARRPDSELASQSYSTEYQFQTMFISSKFDWYWGVGKPDTTCYPGSWAEIYAMALSPVMLLSMENADS